jgi:hypothetical protein
MLSPSPDAKRRRFNDESRRFNNEPTPPRGYATSPVSFNSSRSYQGTPISATGYRQQPLPGPAMLVRQATPMGPPPPQSPIVQQSRYGHPTRSSTYNESLRLPPLQTQMASKSPTTSQRPEMKIEHRDSQAMGVEAMIMSIPFLNKIRILHKIAPPLCLPGFGSPVPQVRGAVVAVEGMDKVLVADIGEFINEYLNKDNSCVVRCWTAFESSLKPSSPGADTEMTDTRPSSAKSPAAADHPAQDPYVEYLTTISDWHIKSLEITNYITNIPPTPFIDPALSHQPSSTNHAGSVSETCTKILPIALLPAGFSLTTSDNFSRRIPITDQYAPVDHWQWMATLWRGIIGPDVTVFAKRASVEEMEKYGEVEIYNELGCLVLRVGENGKMDEKTARRLKFEVLEMARGADSKPRK